LSNFRTTAQDIDRTVAAIKTAMEAWPSGYRAYFILQQPGRCKA